MQDATVVTQVLDELGARFGSTGAHLWEQLVLREIATAYMGLGISVFLCLVAGILWVMAGVKDDDDWTGMAAVATLVALVITVAMAATTIPVLVAPEAAVLKGLLP